MELIQAVWDAIRGQIAWWQVVVLVLVLLVAAFKGGEYLRWYMVIRRIARSAYEHVEEEFGSEYAERLKQRLYGFQKLGPYMEYIVGKMDEQAAKRFQQSPTAQAIAAKVAAKLSAADKGNA